MSSFHPTQHGSRSPPPSASSRGSGSAASGVDMPAAAAAAGSPWRAAIDTVSGRTYYFHSVTRRVSWEKPVELQSYEQSLMRQHSPAVKKEAACPSPLRPQLPLRSLADALDRGSPVVGRVNPTGGVLPRASPAAPPSSFDADADASPFDRGSPVATSPSPHPSAFGDNAPHGASNTSSSSSSNVSYQQSNVSSSPMSISSTNLYSITTSTPTASHSSSQSVPTSQPARLLPPADSQGGLSRTTSDIHPLPNFSAPPQPLPLPPPIPSSGSSSSGGLKRSYSDVQHGASTPSSAYSGLSAAMSHPGAPVPKRSRSLSICSVSSVNTLASFVSCASEPTKDVAGGYDPKSVPLYLRRQYEQLTAPPHANPSSGQTHSAAPPPAPYSSSSQNGSGSGGRAPVIGSLVRGGGAPHASHPPPPPPFPAFASVHRVVAAYPPRKQRATQAEQQDRWASGDPRWRKKLWKCNFCCNVINRNMKSKHPCLDPNRRRYSQYLMASYVPQPRQQTQAPPQRPQVQQHPPAHTFTSLPPPPKPYKAPQVNTLPASQVPAYFSQQKPFVPLPKASPFPPPNASPAQKPVNSSKPTQAAHTVSRAPAAPQAVLPSPNLPPPAASRIPPPPPPPRLPLPNKTSSKTGAHAMPKPASPQSASPSATPPVPTPLPVSASTTMPLPRSGGITSLNSVPMRSSGPAASVIGRRGQKHSYTQNAKDSGASTQAATVSKNSPTVDQRGLEPFYESDLARRLKALAASQNAKEQRRVHNLPDKSAPTTRSRSISTIGNANSATVKCEASEKVPRTLAADFTAPRTDIDIPRRSRTPIPRGSSTHVSMMSSAPNSPGFGPQYSMEFAEGRTESSAASMPLHTLGSPLSSPVSKHKSLPHSSSTWQAMEFGSSPAVFPAISISPVIKHASFPAPMRMLGGSGESSPMAPSSDCDASLGDSLSRARPMSPMAVGSDLAVSDRLSGDRRPVSPPSTGSFEPNMVDALSGDRPMSPAAVGSDIAVSSSFGDDRPMSPAAVEDFAERSVTPVAMGNVDFISRPSSATPMEIDTVDLDAATSSSSSHGGGANGGGGSDVFVIGTLQLPEDMESGRGNSDSRRNNKTDALDLSPFPQPAGDFMDLPSRHADANARPDAHEILSPRPRSAVRDGSLRLLTAATATAAANTSGRGERRARRLQQQRKESSAAFMSTANWNVGGASSSHGALTL